MICIEKDCSHKQCQSGLYPASTFPNEKKGAVNMKPLILTSINKKAQLDNGKCHKLSDNNKIAEQFPQ
jgi:hypothetical protein